MLKNKRIVILGAGESGVGAALLAKAKGFIPFVSDAGEIKKVYKKKLLKNAIPHEEGGHSEELLLTADEVIKSPGIPDNISILNKIREHNIPVISEIEFASRYANGRIIAITGTNGKTTTSYLTHHLLKKAGFKVCLAGNVGISFSSEVMKDKYDFYVVEISSFQLDHIQTFKPYIGILLNITPDHLDRYEYDMTRYVESKFRLVENMDETDCLVYFDDDTQIKRHLDNHVIQPKKLSISLTSDTGATACMNGKYLKFNLPEAPVEEWKVLMAELPLKGPHNMVNTMAAVMVAGLLKIPGKTIMKGLTTFKSVPHRLEKITDFQGRTFINDSKATNLDATLKALASFDDPVILIAGGIDKGNDYGAHDAWILGKIKGLVCLGKDNQKLVDAFGSKMKKLAETGNMAQAVEVAFNMSNKGDVILLSPACASFDLFQNYEDRGRTFRKEVMSMIEKMKNKK